MAYQLPPQLDTPCVFCRPELQPERLFETESLFTIPDKYPLVPGHTLIITKAHVRCYGMASDRHLAELEECAAVLRPFLEREYGAPVLILENGIAGQTVFHAHLHLIPVEMESLGAAITEHQHVLEIERLEEMEDYLMLRGHYRYLELHGRRFLVAGYSPLMRELRSWLSRATGLNFGPNGWEKRTTQEDVLALNRRWRARAVHCWAGVSKDAE